MVAVTMRLLLFALTLAGAGGLATARRTADGSVPMASGTLSFDAGPELALRRGPGMTELRPEVRSNPVGSPAGELDLTDNRLCRRPDPVDRSTGRHSHPFQENGQ